VVATPPAGWRRQMARKNPNVFRRLSSRAAKCFAKDRTPTGRIEFVCHLLCGDPERGAGELVELDRKWKAAGAEHAVSFVSVTQSFNTTSGMGRLTLKGSQGRLLKLTPATS
jgi:hypothetical protein